MPAPPRQRSRRDRPSSYGERNRRNQEAQEAAFEAAKAVRHAAVARRDAEWKVAAEENRRRSLVVLGAPGAVALVIALVGIAWLPVLVAGSALVLIWLALAGTSHLQARKLISGFEGQAPADAARTSVISRQSAERLTDLSEELSAVLGLHVPELRVVADDAPNAICLAVRPTAAVLVATSGLLAQLDRIELEAVIAHELSHLKRLDVLPAIVGTTVVGRLFVLVGGRRAANWLYGADREARADLACASVTHYPPGLISAYERIASVPSSRPTTLGRSVLDRTSEQWLVPFGPGAADLMAFRLDLLREL